MARIASTVADLIGNTPLVRINHVAGDGVDVVAKVEAFNPASSVKDRIARSIIDAAEASGALAPGGTIVEATSGNTGIALSMVGAARGYKVVIVMPASMSIERRAIVRAFGAVANGGVPLTPHFLVYRGEEQVEWAAGERIISEETVAQEIDMMRGVMTEGSGTSGGVEGYDFAGKTGTGEQADESGGYRDDYNVSSLCAFANASAPEILLYVGLNGTPYLSSASSGVVFNEIARQAVGILGISPAS